MAQYHRLAVVNILSFQSFISESCPLFLELLSFKSFEAECDACTIYEGLKGRHGGKRTRTHFKENFLPTTKYISL